MAEALVSGTMTDPTRFSIVIPAYDSEGCLGRAIESVIQQRFAEWRLVVVNDGSSDGTAEVAAHYAARDRRIEVISQGNQGAAGARNAGVARCHAEFVVLLDADDELLPEHLQSMDRFVRAHPGYDIYHPNLRVVLPDGSESLFSDCAHERSFGFADLLRSCVIAVGGAVVRADFFDRFGEFRLGVRCEDYELWLRATALGARPLYTPVPLYVYHQDRQDRRSADDVAGTESAIQSLEELLREGVVPKEYVSQTVEALDAKRQLVVALRQEREMKSQADRFRRRLEKLVGVAGAQRLAPFVRALARQVRPFRRALAGSRTRRRMRRN